MADRQPWQLYPAGSPDLADELIFRDVSDNVSNPAGKLKRMTIAQLAALLSGGGDDGGSGDDIAWTLYSQATKTVESAGETTGDTVGLHFNVSEACPLAAVWLYSPSGWGLTALPTAIGLYNYTTKAQIHTETGVTWSGAAGSGWVRAAFASPPELAAGTEYMAAAFRSSGAWLIYDSDTGWSGEVTHGPITAPVDDGNQGWFNRDNTTEISFPGSQLAGYNWYLDVEVLAPADSGGGDDGGSSGVPVPPLIGMYNPGGTFSGAPSSWPSGPMTNMTAQYFSMDASSPWSEFGAPFVASCAGADIFGLIEVEGWNFDQSPILVSDITAGHYDTWLEDLGTSIAASGKKFAVTWNHEMNVSGQYPWAWNDSGSGPGGGELSPSGWITGWKYVRDKVNSTAGGNAVWLWACAADTGGSSTTSPSAWWPGSGFVDMVGIDGYEALDGSPTTFAGVFASALSDIRALGWTDWVFIAETNLKLMIENGGDSITAFVGFMFANKMSGAFEFEDTGLPQMTSGDWLTFLAAITANYS